MRLLQLAHDRLGSDPKMSMATVSNGSVVTHRSTIGTYGAPGREVLEKISMRPSATSSAVTVRNSMASGHLVAIQA